MFDYCAMMRCPTCGGPWNGGTCAHCRKEAFAHEPAARAAHAPLRAQRDGDRGGDGDPLLGGVDPARLTVPPQDPRLARLMAAQREVERLRREEWNCPERAKLTQAALEAISAVIQWAP